MNPGIMPTEKDKEKTRMLKLTTYVLADFVRGLVYKIEREIEELKHQMQKKDLFFPMNEKGEPLPDNIRQEPQSSDLQIDKDDYFIQMRAKVDLLKNERRRLLIEIERVVRENVDLRNQKQKIIDTTKAIIDEIKFSNDNLMNLLNDKQTEVDYLKKDVTDRNLLINKLKEKVSEFQKLEEKMKMLEHKYIMDLGIVKVNHDKEVKVLNKELNNK